MGSIIGSYHTATVALQQDQIALDVTGNNISNQNTAGYARRSITFVGADTVSLSGAVPAQTPSAVTTTQRSAVLDDAVNATTAAATAATTLKAAMNDLQSVFAIDSSGNEGSGINAAMSGYFGAMQALAADPTSTSARQSALTAASAVATAFQNTSTTLAQQSANLDSTVRNALPSLNTLTASIASLNDRIAQAPNTATRDTLIDQRTAQITSVSQLIGLQQTNDADGTVSLYTTSGATLVVGGMSNAVSTNTAGGTLALYVQGHDITNGLQGGSIGGALAARDGALAGTQGSLDGLANAFAAAVNTANGNGLTLAGAAGQTIFGINASAAHAAGSLTVVATSGADFAAAGSGEGASGTTNANAMAALANQTNASGETFAGILSAAISSVGTAASSASTAATAASAAQMAAASNQEALSGVSLDTEAANLTQYQRSYQAEAKLLAILNQIMVDTINLGTNTAVS